MNPAKQKSVNLLTLPLLIAAAIVHVLLIGPVLSKSGFTFQAVFFAFEAVLLGAAFLASDKYTKTGPGPMGQISRREALLLAAGSVLAVFLYMFDYDSWKYSVIGDEWHFIEYARDLASGFVRPGLFSEHGVYELPVMASVFQLAFIKVFGLLLGWKLSSAVIVPACIFPFYAWVKSVFDRDTAVIAVITLVSSVPMLAFGHIGYINIQDVVFFAFGLFFLDLAIKRNSAFYSFMTALVMGLGFYSFHPARLMPVIGAVYYFMHPERKKLSGARLAIILLVFSAVISYLAATPGFISNMINRTFTQMPEMNPNSVPEKQKAVFVLINFVMTFLVFAFNNDVSKFVWGGLSGIAGAAACAIGMAVIITGFKKDWRLHFLGAVLVIFALFLGGLSPYWYPPNSRTQFMTPLLALLAALGAMLFIGRIVNERARLKVVLLTAGVIAATNFFIFYAVMPSKTVFSDASYYIKALQEAPKDSKLCLVVPVYATIDRMQLKNYYGFTGRFFGTTGIGDAFRDFSFVDKVCVISPDALGNNPELIALAGKKEINNAGKLVACVYDFRANNGLYMAVKSKWESIQGNRQ